MRISRRWGVLRLLRLLGAAALLIASVRGTAQEKAEMENPLSPLARLVGGYWRIEGGKPLDAYHEFTWGRNRRTIQAVFYVVGDGVSPDLVRAEGFYYWDPESKQITGLVIGAGGEVFDGRFTPDRTGWTQDFQHRTAQGSVSFRETWVFPDTDTYLWTLLRKTEDGLKQQMQATFRRVKARPGVR